MGKAIVISGTPGVGKTLISKELASRLSATYINLSEIVIRYKLYLGFDEVRSSYIIDEDKVRSFIDEFIRSSKNLVIIDSHYGELVSDELLLKIFVLRLKPTELLKRLRSRYGSNIKVYENVEAEILGICTYNALKEHPDKVCEIDVTNKDVNEIVREILDILEGKSECYVGIDWLNDEDTQRLIYEITRIEDTNYEWL